MSVQIAFNHPKQKLLFYIAQDFGEEIPAIVHHVVGEIARARDWLIEPPRFIDEIHASNMGTPVRTVGGLLLVYSAFPPWELPLDADKQHFEEVTWLIEALRRFSGEHNLAIEFELDGTFVGSVEDGRIDRTLAEGFLGEWRRELERRGNS